MIDGSAPKRRRHNESAEHHHLMLSEMIFLFEERSPHPSDARPAHRKKLAETTAPEINSGRPSPVRLIVALR